MGNLELFGAPAPAVPADAAIKAEALRVQLNTWGHAYYVQDAPQVPDAEYDRVFRELQALEEAHENLRLAKVRVEAGTICLALESGDDRSVEVLVQGEAVAVTRDAPVVVPLTPVPVLVGTPSVRDIEGSVREDGSVVRATVPPHPMADEAQEATD